jgi:hypothetical protein
MIMKIWTMLWKSTRNSQPESPDLTTLTTSTSLEIRLMYLELFLLFLLLKTIEIFKYLALRAETKFSYRKEHIKIIQIKQIISIT